MEVYQIMIFSSIVAGIQGNRFDMETGPDMNDVYNSESRYFPGSFPSSENVPEITPQEFLGKIQPRSQNPSQRSAYLSALQGWRTKLDANKPREENLMENSQDDERYYRHDSSHNFNQNQNYNVRSHKKRLKKFEKKSDKTKANNGNKEKNHLNDYILDYDDGKNDDILDPEDVEVIHEKRKDKIKIIEEDEENIPQPENEKIEKDQVHRPHSTGYSGPRPNPSSHNSYQPHDDAEECDERSPSISRRNRRKRQKGGLFVIDLDFSQNHDKDKGSKEDNHKDSHGHHKKHDTHHVKKHDTHHDKNHKDHYDQLNNYNIHQDSSNHDSHNHDSHNIQYDSSNHDNNHDNNKGSQSECKCDVNKVDRKDYDRFGDIGWFKIHPEELNWNQAREACVAEGAHLAVPRSKKEWEWIQERKNGKFLWLGLHDQFVEGQWTTVLDEDMTKSAYIHWNRFPDNFGGKENCGLLQDALEDVRCERPWPFLCKIEFHKSQ